MVFLRTVSKCFAESEVFCFSALSFVFFQSSCIFCGKMELASMDEDQIDVSSSQEGSENSSASTDSSEEVRVSMDTSTGDQVSENFPIFKPWPPWPYPRKVYKKDKGKVYRSYGKGEGRNFILCFAFCFH